MSPAGLAKLSAALIAFGLFIYAVGWTRPEASMDRELATNGQVATAIVTNRDSDSVDYQFEVANKVYHGHDWASSDPALGAGSPIQVRYIPEDPELCAYQSAARQATHEVPSYLAAVFAEPGLICLGIAAAWTLRIRGH